MAAQGSQLTNKYAEGYPASATTAAASTSTWSSNWPSTACAAVRRRTYANVQPNSGSQANQAVFFGLLQPGDTIMGMSLAEGGHLTHGMALNMSGKWFKVVSYGLNADEAIDYDAMERLAHEHKPKLIIAGASAYSLRIDFERFARVAKAVGAYFMVDMAHYAGLIAAGVYPNPVPHADVVTSTTHKSLRGPRGGIILMNGRRVAKKINSAIFPGIQGGPLMHVIAAKAVAFQEALAPEFKVYQQQVVTTPACWPRRWPSVGCASSRAHGEPRDAGRPAPQGPDRQGGRGRAGPAHMTCNKNGIPNDPQKPMVTSGIRLGSPAMTTRGFGEDQARQTAHLIADVLDAPHDEARDLAAVRAKVAALDAGLPGLPLTAADRKARPAPDRPPCAAPTAATPKPRSSRPANPTRATSSGAAGAACVRQALHHLRARRDRDAGGGQEGRRAGRVRPRQAARSMMLALRKRPVSVEQVDAAIERIQDKLLASGAREVPSAASASW
jgi:glycine hydroxymethyltransferase